MARVLVLHTCGHKSRVEVGDGTARTKSAVAFEASLCDCPNCTALRCIADKEPVIMELLTPTPKRAH